jgi:hypothetical protein
MTADRLAAEARANQSETSPPALKPVEQSLRKPLATLLKGFDYEANLYDGPAHICRVIAAILAEVQDLQRRH